MVQVFLHYTFLDFFMFSKSSYYNKKQSIVVFFTSIGISVLISII